MRAAEYVRVSTDHQQYSILNQQAAIAEYAAKHGFEIVRTYSDPARSGLDIKRRPGLQCLIDDVTSGRADYKTVLVFDVSRWGRFQDCDEAACYEFLCKRANIKVCYCAEPFENDGGVLSSITKMIKRTMAAEYVRDLSRRVRAGQCRLASMGFRLGGSPGLGYRRVLLGSNGKVKQVLLDGEEKQLATDRVSLGLGPRREVLLVKRIFSMYVDQTLGVRTIVRILNTRGVLRPNGEPFNQNFLRRLLEHPKYIGCAVFNRQSQTLHSKPVVNSRDKWIIVPNAFPPIVSQEMFARAEERRRNLVVNRSNEQLLEDLKAYVEKHGKGLPSGRKTEEMASPRTYQLRFGSCPKAYEAIGFRRGNYTSSTAELVQRINRLRRSLYLELQSELQRLGISGTWKRRRHFTASEPNCGTLVLLMGRYQHENNRSSWHTSTRQLRGQCWPVVARCSTNNDSVLDFVYFPWYACSKKDYVFGEHQAEMNGVVYRTLSEVAISFLLSCGRFPN